MIRVTQVLEYFTEPELLTWYKQMGFKKAEEISQQALRVGTMVDTMIQHDLKGLSQDSFHTLSFEEQAMGKNCLSAWQLFNQAHPAFRSAITGIQTEVTDGEIVGHPDLEITMPPRIEAVRQETVRWGIVDIKTSRAIQPKHWTQTAKYLHLKYPDLLTASPFCYFTGILRLDKQTGQYEYRELTNPLDILYEVKVFDAYLTAYQHGQRIREVLRQQLEQEVFE